MPADYPPFAAAAGDGFAGLDVDVLGRFAADTHRRLELVAFRWPTLLDDLRAGRFAVAAGGVTMRPERAVAGRFTRPVLETGAVVLVRWGLAQKASDLDRAGARLAVNRGGHLEQVARRLFPHAFLQTVADNRALAAPLAAGTVDGIVTDDAEADLLLSDLPPIERFGPLTRDRKAYLTRDDELAAELDGWLRARDADGTLDALRVKWVGERGHLGRTAFDADVAALLALVDLRMAFMPSIAAAKEQAGLPIVDATQEARVLADVAGQAATLGMAPEAATELFRVLMAAARDAQRAYLALPRDRRPPAPPLDLTRDARPALARVSTDLLARAADLARRPDELARVDPARLADGLDPDLAPPSARRAIAAAIVALGRRRAAWDPKFVKAFRVG